MLNIEPPPFRARQLGRPGHVDRWQIVTLQAPSVIVGDVGVAPAGTGAPQGNRSQGVNGAFLAAVTPETSAPVTTSGISSGRSATHARHQAGACE
jgi:vanillate O-demethylase monooxygenase subunit